MNSKKILEEMFEIVKQKSEEELDENSFNRSLLKNIGLENPQEINEVLLDLLIILKKGEESIGEISNGEFVCFPEVIKKVEKDVTTRLREDVGNGDKEEKYFAGTNEDKIEDNLESKKIDQLLSNYANLDLEDVDVLFEGIAKMDEEQFGTFLESVNASGETLVDEKIITDEEQARVKRGIIIERLLNGDDEKLKEIASNLILLENDEINDFERLKIRIALTRALREDIPQEVKNLLEEYGIKEYIFENGEQTLEDANEDTIDEQKDKETYDTIKEKYMKYIDEYSKTSKQQTHRVVDLDQRLRETRKILQGDKKNRINDIVSYIKAEGEKVGIAQEEISRILQSNNDPETITRVFLCQYDKHVYEYKEIPQNDYKNSKIYEDESKKQEPVDEKKMDTFFNESSIPFEVADVQVNDSVIYNDKDAKEKWVRKPNDKLKIETLERSNIYNLKDKEEINDFVKTQGSMKGLENAALMLFSVGEIIQGKDGEEVDDNKNSTSSEQGDEEKV